MSDVRESFITIRSEEFKEEDSRFNITLRLDIGKNEYQERLQKIQQLGVEPSNNVVVITHDFESEEAAQDMVVRLNGFKETMGTELGELSECCETIKAEGRQLITCIRAPGELAAVASMLEPFAASIGEIADANQFVEFKIASTSNLKDVLTTQSESPAAVLLSGILIKLSLALHKDLAIKLTDFACNTVPEYEKQEVKMSGRLISSFRHLKLNIELRNPDENTKGAYKNEMIGGIMGMAQFVCGLTEQFGFLDVAKNGGAQTVARLCVSPILSAEFNLYAPTAIEALEKAANPM